MVTSLLLPYHCQLLQNAVSILQIASIYLNLFYIVRNKLLMQHIFMKSDVLFHLFLGSPR